MSLGVSGVNDTTYTANVKTEGVSENVTAKTSEAAGNSAQASATYEKGTTVNSGTYSINKMSAEDRASLVSQLKADQEARQSQLTSLVSQMLGKQATAFANATDMWRFLADGNFTVDAETKAQAQADISEDGYWGVKQTSQRLFDFASALAGDDVEKMHKMQEAMMKGFDLATSTWGKELPSISKDTINAANKLFEDYYASKNIVVEEAAQ